VKKKIIIELIAASDRIGDHACNEAREWLAKQPDDGDIWAECANSDWRYWAALRLTDQSVLAAIAQSDEVFYVRYVATKRLTDQAVLAAIAQTDEDSDVRSAATKRLTEIAESGEIQSLESLHNELRRNA
jgi:hypothetical protein